MSKDQNYFLGLVGFFLPFSFPKERKEREGRRIPQKQMLDLSCTPTFRAIILIFYPFQKEIIMDDKSERTKGVSTGRMLLAQRGS
jgi:hypothetical protein